MMQHVQIDDDVKMPRSKGARTHEEKVRRTFRVYADAYQAAHVKRPELTHIAKDSVDVDFGSHRSTFTLKRLKELTNMLRNRVKDR